MRTLCYLAICAAVCVSWSSPAAAAGSVLYATDSDTQQLFVVSTTNGAATLVGDFGVAGYMAGLTYDTHNNILYGVDTATESLYSISRTTGAATWIGSLGVTLMHSIAFDNVNGVLYGASTADSCLYGISTATGHATLIGSIGAFFTLPLDTVCGLAFRPSDNALYGCISGPSYVGGLVKIDTATGHGTFQCSTQPLVGLAFDPGTGVLYGADNGFGVHPDALYQIDPSSGQALLIGLTGLENNLDIAFAPIPEPSAIIALLCGIGGLGSLAWRRKSA